MNRLLSAAAAVPGIRYLVAHRRAYRRLKQLKPGHFHSAIPSMEEVRRDAARIFDRTDRAIAGIDLNVEGQLATLGRLAAFYPECPYEGTPRPGLRYRPDNTWFDPMDAVFLYGMMRDVRPRRIIEVGSGFSSMVMLDTNEHFFDRKIRLTFIEPNDARLRSGLKREDLDTAELVNAQVQNVPLDRFDALESGDILFIDSSHVSKIGSDVNHLFFEVLPRLRAGVMIHVHDIFFPFEYPMAWLERNRYWTESYLVRAFLQFNAAFKITAWNNYLHTHHREALVGAMPLCAETGSSLWLRRAAPAA